MTRPPPAPRRRRTRHPRPGTWSPRREAISDVPHGDDGRRRGERGGVRRPRLLWPGALLDDGPDGPGKGRLVPSRGPAVARRAEGGCAGGGVRGAGRPPRVAAHGAAVDGGRAVAGDLSPRPAPAARARPERAAAGRARAGG